MSRRPPKLELVETAPPAETPDPIVIDLTSGTVLIGSDLHAWPGPWTTGMRAFLCSVKKLKPDVVILNGDTLDGAILSRFPRMGWEKRPALREEVEAAQAFLDAIKRASPKARHILTRGNHCQRVEAALANKLPEFEGMPGTRLQDLFPGWEVCWSVELPGATVKHRWHNGQNAARQNALKSGRSYVTGHLHSLQVSAVTDLQGTRYGVDTGTLANVRGPQFAYREGAPRDWRSGFAVLTFQAGRLLFPELGMVLSETDGTWAFRGQVYQADAEGGEVHQWKRVA